jgi:hypothetical protein
MMMMMMMMEGSASGEKKKRDSSWPLRDKGSWLTRSHKIVAFKLTCKREVSAAPSGANQSKWFGV